MQTASDFSLPDQNGRMHKLSDYRGQWVVLFFYPRDNTPTCTTEVCSFRDNSTELTANNIAVLGVSADSIKSHQGFSNKNQLNFPILSDESKDVIKQYKAWGKKTVFGVEVTGVLRRTYLINPEGNIVKFYEQVDPTGHKHTKEILETINSY